MRYVQALLLFFLTLHLATGNTQQFEPTALEQFIQKEMREQNIPGLSAAIVKNDQLVWRKGFGMADKEKRVPVTENTLFLIASISKSVTAQL